MRGSALALALCWLAVAQGYSAPRAATTRTRARCATRSGVAAIRAAEEDGVTVRVRTPGAPAAAPPTLDADAAVADVKVTVRAPTAAASATEPAPTASDAVVSVRAPERAAPPPPPPGPNGVLIEASRTASIAGVRAALEAGADPNAKDAQGFSAMHLCAATGLAPGVVVLAKAGADLEYRAQNLTPLTIAVGYNKPFTVKTIVECGAAVNEPDADGVLPANFIASLIAAEVEADSKVKENPLTRRVNKRLDALRQMEQAIALAPDGRVPPEQARENLDGMYAELAKLLKW
ncbi:hypothetical protein KFE25_008370 [Diacronema lutheri]|uniref:Uncharacterized protein n=2 Tax=Diacronema lutheri TaxID=2081491 RepID=A0A8J5XE01_DIALT|nr:hypothetical protein KFE25_008370 [Diacronema lutheri]